MAARKPVLDGRTAIECRRVACPACKALQWQPCGRETDPERGPRGANHRARYEEYQVIYGVSPAKGS